jgi:hypothetical protein
MVEIIELTASNAHPELYLYTPGELVDVRMDSGTVSPGWKLIKPSWKGEENSVYWHCFRAGDGYTNWNQQRFIKRNYASSQVAARHKSR